MVKVITAFVVFTVFIFCGLLLLKGQDAQVVILTTEDSQLVSKSWMELKAAQTKWEDTKKFIESKYRIDNSHSDWRWGFTFSNDFHAVVPNTDKGINGAAFK